MREDDRLAVAYGHALRQLAFQARWPENISYISRLRPPGTGWGRTAARNLTAVGQKSDSLASARRLKPIRRQATSVRRYAIARPRSRRVREEQHQLLFFARELAPLREEQRHHALYASPRDERKPGIRVQRGTLREALAQPFALRLDVDAILGRSRREHATDQRPARGNRRRHVDRREMIRARGGGHERRRENHEEAEPEWVACLHGRPVRGTRVQASARQRYQAVATRGSKAGSAPRHGINRPAVRKGTAPPRGPDREPPAPRRPFRGQPARRPQTPASR